MQTQAVRTHPGRSWYLKPSQPWHSLSRLNAFATTVSAKAKKAVLSPRALRSVRLQDRYSESSMASTLSRVTYLQAAAGIASCSWLSTPAGLKPQASDELQAWPTATSRGRECLSTVAAHLSTYICRQQGDLSM